MRGLGWPGKRRCHARADLLRLWWGNPTITDANLVLGRLNAEKLLSTSETPSIDKIRAILQDKIADPLGTDVDQAAGAIIRVANDRMAGAVRIVSISKGYDPRDFTLFAFGGAGPLHAASLGRELVSAHFGTARPVLRTRLAASSPIFATILFAP